MLRTELILEYLEKNNMTMKEFSEKCMMGWETYKWMFNPHENIDDQLEQLYIVAKVIDVDLVKLLGY